MKESIYNVYLNKGEELIVYNTVTSAVLLLDDDNKLKFENFLKHNDEKYLDDELQTNLKKGGMIQDSDIDELDLIKLQHNIGRLRSDSLSLTIAPTSDCNFRCPYCYESGIKHTYMNDDVINDLYTFIENHKKQKINVSWYGGEPTLCMSTIVKISKNLIQKYGKDNYYASMVTNGYLLTKDMAIVLKENNVNHVQITIDGDKAFHDKRRIFKDGSGTYDTIMKNIKNIYNILPVIIRMNVDKTNISTAINLIQDLKDNDLLDKVKFYIAPVQDINATQRNHNCFTQRDFSEYEMDFYNRIGKDYTMKPPMSNLGICGAICLDSFVIAPDGELYKCWDEIGRREFSIGNLREGIKNYPNYIKWVTYDIEKYNKNCMKCVHLPTCYGGCPYRNIMGKADDNCLSFKYNGEQVIENLYHNKEISKE